jgi:DNA-binding CsgD family transcriptional regulator
MTMLETVQCPILVGRDHVLDLADEALIETRTGHGRTILVAGEAGIGKTRLIRAIRRRATAAGFRCLQGDLAPHDADVPLAVLRDVFRTMRMTPDVRDLGDELLDRCDRAVAEGGVYSRSLVLEIVDRMRVQLVDPTVLVFEDLQWADDMSLEAIAELARVAGDQKLLIIAAYRRDETPPGTPLRDWRSRLLTQRRAEEVRLERLTIDETATMTTLLMGTGLPAPRDVVQAVHVRSDGLPLHVEELIAAARATGSLDVDAIRGSSVPDTIEDAVLARTARRSAEAQAVARAGAVIGRCFDPSVLAGVMDRPAAELDEPLRELIDHGILYDFGTIDAGYYDFRHQLLRDALYRSVPDGERRRYHARAGEFGASLEGASEVHASLHYERAGLRDEAFRAARAGAEQAVRLSAHREAFELYRRAVRNLPPGTPDLERAELLDAYSIEASAIEHNELSEEMAWAARDAFLAAGAPARAVLAVSMVNTIWRRMGRSLRARIALIERTEAEVAAIAESPERDQAAHAIAFDRLATEVDLGRFDIARRTAAALADAVDGTDDEDYAAAIDIRLAMVDVLSGDPDRGLAAMIRISGEARESGAEEMSVTAYRDAAVFAVRVMAYDRAEASLAEGLAYADSVQQSQCAHIMAAVVAETDWAAGRWDAAVPVGEQAIADRGCLRAPAMARWAIGFVAMGRGEHDRARSLLEQARRFGDESELIEWRMPPAWGLAENDLLDGDAAAAIDRCEQAYDALVDEGERSLLAMFIVTGVRAYQAAGRPSDADRWLARCAGHLAATPAFGRAALAHGAGLVALAGGSTGAARSSLETAVAEWDRHGRLWEGLWARLDLAACLVRNNRFAAAVALASQVMETAGRLKSPALLARAEELVRQARGRVVPDEPWRPLTVREFEVARLIAEGRTNGEIAEELGIAPKTASSHVEHILAKLGASRRAEIASWASNVERGGSAGVGTSVAS